MGAALRTEYQAIVDAGFILQIDDPFLSDLFGDPSFDAAQRAARAEIYVAALNASLAGIPPERVRYHTCYGINHGPRIHEAALADIAGYMLRVNAGAYSFEAANARHEHEYHLWETVKLRPGKVLIPGVITHSSNIVEHPEWIAERLVRFARHRWARERGGGGRLRVLLAGDLSAGGPSDGDLGEVRGAARRGADRQQAAVEVSGRQRRPPNEAFRSGRRRLGQRHDHFLRRAVQMHALPRRRTMRDTVRTS